MVVRRSGRTLQFLAFSAHAELVGQLFFLLPKTSRMLGSRSGSYREERVRGARATGDERSRSACGARDGPRPPAVPPSVSFGLAGLVLRGTHSFQH